MTLSRQDYSAMSIQTYTKAEHTTSSVSNQDVTETSINAFDVIFVVGYWEEESNRYRIHNIAEGLAKIGYRVQVMPFDHIAVLAEQYITSDTVVIYRAPYDINNHVDVFLEFAKRKGIKVVYDVDDLIFDTNVLDQIENFQLLSPDEQANHFDRSMAHRKLLLASDIVTVPNEYLREYVVNLGKQAFCIPNSFNYAPMSEAIMLPTKNTNIIRIGILSDDQTCQSDFSECEESLLKIMLAHENTVFRIIGKLDLDTRWNVLAPRVEQFKLTHPLDAINPLHACSINIIPLRLSSAYSHCRSEAKFIEAALLDIPTIASATDTYTKVIRNGVNGITVTTSEEWQQALEALINYPELRSYIGDNAKQTANSQYDINNNATIAAKIYGLNMPSNTYYPVKYVNSDCFTSNILTISWVVPELIIGGGGHRNILRTAYFLAQFGHKITLYFTSDKHTPEELKKLIQENFYPLDCEVYIFKGFIYPSDVVFATHWSTVSAALTARATAKEIMYFVQDFEPLFAPMSTEYVLAENTYRLGLYHITSGPWCEKVLRRDFNARADHFLFPLDNSIYYSRSRTKTNKNIVYFAKPEMPRRCFELGVMALSAFHRLRPDVEIIMFGSKNAHNHVYDFPVTIKSLLPTLNDLAELYSNADIGLVFSTTNPSLIPYEMMACGLPVVDLERGDNNVNYGGRNDIALLVDALPEKMALQIATLIDNETERLQRRANSLDFVSRLPSEEEMARRVEQLILNRLQEISDKFPNSTLLLCPSCESQKGFEDYTQTGLVTCKSCSSIVNLKDLLASKESQIKAQCDSSMNFYSVDETLLNNIPQEIAKRTPIINFLLDQCPNIPRSVFVDFGAGYGLFSLAAQPYFDRVCAIEINKNTIQKVLSSSDTGRLIEVFSSLEDILVSSISVCFMWHVIEHMPDAVEQLRNVYKKLSADGCIIAQVPMYKEEYVCTTHYHFLNEHSVRIMCEKAGLNQVSTYIDHENNFLTFIAKK